MLYHTAALELVTPVLPHFPALILFIPYHEAGKVGEVVAGAIHYSIVIEDPSVTAVTSPVCKGVSNTRSRCALFDYLRLSKIYMYA